MCRCVHMSTGASRDQKRELEIVMSHMTWMLGTGVFYKGGMCS